MGWTTIDSGILGRLGLAAPKPTVRWRYIPHRFTVYPTIEYSRCAIHWPSPRWETTVTMGSNGARDPSQTALYPLDPVWDAKNVEGLGLNISSESTCVRLSKLLVHEKDINIIWKGPIANYSFVAILPSCGGMHLWVYEEQNIWPNTGHRNRALWHCAKDCSRIWHVQPGEPAVKQPQGQQKRISHEKTNWSSLIPSGYD